MVNMTGKQLRWGIVGCGLISGDMVEAIRLLPSEQHKIAAVASKSLERCKEFCSKHDLSETIAYGSYEELISDPNIDIVYIATRNHQHFEVAQMALKAKKNVLCEKPLGMNKAQVKEMIATAKENDVFFQEAFWSRFFPIYKDVKKTLDERTIGDVVLVQADLGLPFMDKIDRLHKPELGAGMALDVGCYLAQLSFFVFGKTTPIESITTVGWKSHDVDDTGSVTIKFAGNKMAQLLFTGCAYVGGRAQIFGTKGRIDIPRDFHCPEHCSVTVLPEEMFAEPTVKEHCHKRPQGDLKKFFFKFTTGLAYEVDGVRKHILEGRKESPEITLDESLRIAEVLDTIRKQLGVTEL
ncbi:Trans-1,2-dihydrobenzene-1,2-diol dehydrogenase [Toxocara canis]|uniref:Trans-1,2-dihydrobenzene-1,2-diol dehydrogenase n=1 Tax=Toxocara canis TaxID=6265 RepID=A0A0B2VQH3_TOXCA|nr:Trans-1,2-dihydrobenzene-1,2-diol dehydrogenase [Toxocara canis]